MTQFFLVIHFTFFAGNYCDEYSRNVKILSAYLEMNNEYMALGRNAYSACTLKGDSLRIADCIKNTEPLKDSIRKYDKHIEITKSQLKSLHDLCDTLILDDVTRKSNDIELDKKLMWQVVEDKDGLSVMPASSINAAIRVFNTIHPYCIGITVDSLKSLIGFKEIKSYKYKNPFHPKLHSNNLVYRFDNGINGMQYEIHLNIYNRVDSISRKWIH